MGTITMAHLYLRNSAFGPFSLSTSSLYTLEWEKPHGKPMKQEFQLNFGHNLHEKKVLSVTHSKTPHSHTFYFKKIKLNVRFEGENANPF